MPHALAFDTHENVKRFEAAGFTEEQAEVQTRIFAELVDEQLVTKAYLDTGLMGLGGRPKEFEYRLIIRLRGMIVVAVGIVATLVKIL